MRRLLYPALLALPFLAGIAALKGLTVEIDTFHGSDARVYHLPTILHFRDQLDFERYPAAQTPLFHVLFAGWGKLVGFELWKLRLLNVVISYGAVLALFGLLRRIAALREVQAFALALVFALSPYFFGASFTLLTDNLAILFALLALGCFERFRREGRLAVFAAGALAMGAAVLTRQSLLWLVLVAAAMLVLAPVPWERRVAGAALAALALIPFAALVATWDGLVPPGSDPASCGLCNSRAGVSGGGLTLRAVGFTVALAGLYAAVVWGPGLLRRLPRPRPGPIVIAGAAAVCLLAISPLVYRPIVKPRAGDAGYLWKASDHLPVVASSSLLFWLLVPLGCLALYLLGRRAGARSLPVLVLVAFLISALPVRLVYQKYFDPFALLILALLVRPPDLRRPLDYAGLAALGVGFAAYALSFAG
jgi:4-amino-4-deoxy-L-arabinose transferase-like glycosyltransferase